jgi:hypothetical protein
VVCANGGGVVVGALWCVMVAGVWSWRMYDGGWCVVHGLVCCVLCSVLVGSVVVGGDGACWFVVV